ncbi:hypothetical protein B0H63DRAFT_486500 [Podospora didyma]|uniref:Uncharacterized protein n=1 Tax=Podospora didyma TaxID=330526 RepID=A0AAE0K522_9PEZI|nr:hypothetical protein B0H63DRAFT_486500 [Podospora didyma]
MSAMRVHTPDEILVELSPSPQGSSFLIQAAPTPPPGTALSPPLSQNPFVPALPPRKPVPLASPPAADRPGEAVQVQYRPSTSHRKPVPVTAPPAQVPSRPPTPQRKTAPTPPPPTPPPTTALPLPPNQDPSHPVPLQRKPVPAAPIRQKTPEPLANPVPAFPFSNLPSGNNSTASNWAEYRASSKPALRNVSLVPDATNPRHTATVLAPPVPALPRLNPFRSPPQRKDTQGAPRVLSPPRRKPVENQASVNQPNPSSNSSPTAPTTAPTWGQDPTYPKPPPPVAPGLSFAEPLSSNVEPRASPPRPTSSWYQPNFIPPPPPESTLPNTVYRQSVYRQSIYRQSTVTPKGSPSKPAPPVPPIPQSSPPRGSPPKTSPPVPPIPQSSPPRGSPPRASTARSSPPTRDSPPRRSPPRPSPPVPRAAHVLSESEESTSSQDSVSSTRPLIVHLRQDSVLSNPSRQDTLLNPSRQSTGLSQSTSPSRPSQSRQSSFFSEKRGPRPGNLNTSRTLYMDMLLALDKIPRLHNILVSFFTWIMLVGFVVMTGSFTSGEIAPPDDGTLGTPVNASMLVVGVVFMGMGMIGVGWLGYRWRKNYVWLLNKLYMPLLLNALAGVVATIVSIYAQHGGQWRLQAILTISVEVFVLIVSSLLFAVYNFWFLVRVKGDHHVAIGRDRKSLAQKVNSARKAPPLAPGSVV